MGEERVEGITDGDRVYWTADRGRRDDNLEARDCPSWESPIISLPRPPSWCTNQRHVRLSLSTGPNHESTTST